jgi:hypothetical protein
MSTLSVNTITAETGNTVSLAAGKTLDASQGLTAPSGHIVQVVTNTVTGVVTQNSTSWVNMLSVSITPKYANSKLYIIAFVGGVYMNLSSNTNQSNWRIARDSGSISASQNTHFHTEEGRNLTSAGTRTHPAMAIIDPTSGSGSRTYSVQSERHTGTGGIQINDTAGTSTITVMEIAQ